MNYKPAYNLYWPAEHRLHSPQAWSKNNLLAGGDVFIPLSSSREFLQKRNEWIRLYYYGTLISLINMKSGLPILKNSTLHKKNSTLLVYWFLRFFPPSTPRLLHLCSGFFQKIPPSMFIDFATFAPPTRLFQPPRLIEKWEYSRSTCFRSFFGRNWRHQKDILNTDRNILDISC